ncbi:MAG: VOC family protein, partial [Pseudomonadota bacterium]
MIANVTLVVPDYDEAIAFFTGVLGFELVEDTVMSETKRFVRVRPRAGGTCLLLAQPKNTAERAAIGNQTGGRVTFFLHTDEFQRAYSALEASGAEFTGPVRHEAYGTVVVFKDPWGNLWDLVQPA